MSSIIESIQKIRTSQSLPLSHSDPDPSSAANGGLRRRLSSLSLKLQTAPSLSASASATASWAAASFRRSKSLSSMGEAAGTSIRRWWDWGWTWILSKKPVFARDLEMNEEEARAIGSGRRGSWKHVLFKVRSEIRKLVGSDAHMGLPQTIRQ
ncbi:uncharacterized protein LOC116206408 [Punica granatum]|uniref:Uncharacterized protein n=2 Tax=Punica granatum TaxID=22663 RepID=A0A218XGE2_PUNGR|nr:uncharacterized protein LOC116206408 [Punica granatum]OWM84037.1 hypothetical protein CDL15_Pgr004469 [Punica granatum]PKI75801.1 hypothetical protein CRG98_003844 [Punica granatum]